ncbi:hypothetical protein G9A89_011081 [Geosiphon pyriformis]|nr:hypothetical protein G9A89_011081 [Geosiphon pyriformis]
MSLVTVEQIYEAYNEINEAGDKASEKKNAYQVLIDGAHGPNTCKRLSARFIPTFFKHFPESYETAIDALFDLCEDTDLIVRLEVIKAIPNVVRQQSSYSVKIADALMQLLQNESTQEIAAVKKALETVIRIDPRGSIVAIFQQSLKGSTDVRNRTISFLAHDMNRFKEEIFKQDAQFQQLFANEVKKALHDAEGPEFEIFVKMLFSLPMYEKDKKNIERLLDELLKAVTSEGGKFNLSDEKRVQKMLLCGKAAVEIFRKGVSSTPFLIFLTTNVLPTHIYSKLQEKQQKNVLRLLAECAIAKPDPTKLKDVVPLVQKLFCTELPAPPDGNAEDPKLDLPRVEYIVCTLYTLSPKEPDLIQDDQVITRLRHLYKVAQTCISRIKQGLNDLQNRPQKDPETSEKIKKAQTGQIVTTNIFSMVKELLKPQTHRKYPKIAFSWQKPSPAPPKVIASSPQLKRLAPGAQPAPGNIKKIKPNTQESVTSHQNSNATSFKPPPREHRATKIYSSFEENLRRELSISVSLNTL